MALSFPTMRLVVAGELRRWVTQAGYHVKGQWSFSTRDMIMMRKWSSMALQLNMDRDRIIDFDERLNFQKNADTFWTAIKGIALV